MVTLDYLIKLAILKVHNLHLIASCDDASTSCHFRVYQNDLKYCIWYLKHQLSQIPFIAETSKPLCYLITQMGNYKVDITCSMSKILRYTFVFSKLQKHMVRDFCYRDFLPYRLFVLDNFCPRDFLF